MDAVTPAGILTKDELARLEGRLGIALECDAGWSVIVRDLAAAMNEVTTEWQAVQVKQKWGVMKFYWAPTGGHAADAPVQVQRFGAFLSLAFTGGAPP